MPTHSELENDQDILDDDVIRGFLEQTKLGTPAPTTRAMSLVYDPLSTAFEQAYSGISTTEDALTNANEELISQMDGLQQAAPLEPNTGYRTIPLEFQLNQSVSNYSIYVDDVLHTQFIVSDVLGTSNSGYDSCTSNGEELNQSGQIRVISVQDTNLNCTLTGMIPNVEHIIDVYADGELYYSTIGSTSVSDQRPSAGDTSPVMFALGAIVLSLIALLSYGRWRDQRLNRTNSRLAHAYIAPALLALAVLTFYPVIYGFWLSFTDADQTHLGDQSFIGLSNFWDVITASGFIRVTIFTIVWTVVNVTAHIGI